MAVAIKEEKKAIKTVLVADLKQSILRLLISMVTTNPLSTTWMGSYCLNKDFTRLFYYVFCQILVVLAKPSDVQLARSN
jgi:hypothetical protein